MARHHGVADGGCALLHLPDCSSLIGKRQLWASRAKCIFPGITQSHLMSYSRVWSCQARPGKVSRVKMTHCKSDSNLSYRETIWEMNCWAKWHGWDLPVAKSTLCVCHWLYMCVCVCDGVCATCVTALLSRLVSSVICLSAASALSFSLSSCSVCLS